MGLIKIAWGKPLVRTQKWKLDGQKDRQTDSWGWTEGLKEGGSTLCPFMSMESIIKIKGFDVMC